MNDKVNNLVEVRDDDEVSRLLASLPRVEAPDDFLFGVKARIARRRTARVTWLSLRNVLAASAFVLIAFAVGIMYIIRSGSTTPSDIDAVSSTKNDITPKPDLRSINERDQSSPGSANLVVTRSEPDRTAASVPAEARSSNANRGTSVDLAAGSSTRIYPKGVGPNTASPQKAHDLQRERTFSAIEILDQLGAGTESSESGIRVTAIRENSIAAKSGLRKGDIVEAINKKPVSGKTTFSGQTSGSSVTVRRDGTSFEVGLKP